MRLPTFIKQAGFTMIELLVVISIIGVLAVAVLASINPIEQINKGSDTRVRSDAAQMANAIDRYFAVHEEFPWNTQDPTTYPNFYDAFEHLLADWGGASDVWVDLLTTTAEVKQGFVNRVRDDARTYLFKTGGTAVDSTASVYVCFQPRSKAFQQEAISRCAGTLETEFPAATACANAPYTPTTAYVDEYICLP